MSDIHQLNWGSDLNSSSDEDLGIFSAFRKEFEILVIRTIEKLIGPALEPLIRKIVSENIDLAQERIIAVLNQPSGERPSSSSPSLKLKFPNKLSLPVLTGKHILGEDGNPMKIELVDENTDTVVKTGPQSLGKVEILALRVNTRSDETDVNSNTSLLNGCTHLYLNQGIASVDKISFPQRSTWTPKCDYVLVARFVDEVGGTSVVEAKSQVFTIEDKRNENYKKHNPPILSDKVLHLVNIGKGGPYEKYLMEKNIITVQNLLTEYFKSPQNLKRILKMTENKFNGTIEHALTCEELKEKYVCYIPGSQQHNGIVLNIVGELFGLIVSKGEFVPVDNLSEIQKDEGKKMVASALKHWGHVVRYNEHSFPSSSGHLVPCEPTLPIPVYDNTQPSTSCKITISPPSLVGPSQINQSNDHTQPSISNNLAISPNTQLQNSHVNVEYSHIPTINPRATGTLFDILLGKSLTNSGYDDPTQPSAPYVNATSSNNRIGTSLFSPDCSNVTSHENSQYEEHQIAVPEDITPSYDTYSYPFEGLPDGANSCPPNIFEMGFGSIDDSLWGSTISQDYSYDPGFIIDDILERLHKDMLSKARIKKWLEMIYVLRFTHKMKLKKSGHVRKRTRCN